MDAPDQDSQTPLTNTPEPERSYVINFPLEDLVLMLDEGGLIRHFPGTFEIGLYRFEDGTYCCAVQGCPKSIPVSEAKNLGRFVLCLEHAGQIRQTLIQQNCPERVRIFDLPRTLENVGKFEVEHAAELAERTARRQQWAGEIEDFLARTRFRAQRKAQEHEREMEQNRRAAQAAEKAQQAPARPAAVAQPLSRPVEVIPPKIAAMDAPQVRTQLGVLQALKEDGVLDELAHAKATRSLYLRLRQLEAEARSAEREVVRREWQRTEARWAEEDQLTAERLAQEDAGFFNLTGQVSSSTPGNGITRPVKLETSVPQIAQAQEESSGEVRMEQTPAQPLIVPCNVAESLKGDARARDEFIPDFVADEFKSAEECFEALGDTGGRYWELLRMHASDVKDEVLRRHDSPERKDAKRMAKACLLHGREFKILGFYRFKVIELIQARWPEEWQQRNAEIGENGDRPHTCAECGCKVRKLFFRPGQDPVATEEICGTCRKRLNNTATLAKRESEAVGREEQAKAVRLKMRGASGGGGGRGSKGGKGRK